MKKLTFVSLLVLFLVGCGQTKVESGFLRDTLFSVEQTRNGNYRAWVTHDDVAGYCTMDRTIGEELMTILQEWNGEVIIEFRSINASDPEYSFWHNSDCGEIRTGADSSTAMFMLLSVERAPKR